MRPRPADDFPAFAIAAAQRDLPTYSAAVNDRIEFPPHLLHLAGSLEAVAEGRLRRLVIAMPPRHGKSLLTSAIFPAWYLGRFPDRQVIFVTYSQEFSEDFGRKVRNLLGSPIHRAIFPTSRVSDDSAAAYRFTTTAGGIYVATGRGGSLTGRGADLMIVDDPLKGVEEANSPGIRRGLHDWFRSDAFTRLQPGGALILIGTRWHEDDLAGMLLRDHPGEGWEVLSFPAIAQEGDAFRKEGEALWPERYPVEELERARAIVGERAWISLYQQRPVAAEGAIFKREWWKFYREVPAFRRVVQFWDTAFKVGSENDYSVCTTWGETQTGFFLLSVWRDRVEFPELKRTAVALAHRWTPAVVLVEDKASGQSLLQELQRETSLPIKAIKVDKDKVTRATSVTPVVETGRVLLPESAPWLADYLDELASFPAAPHDDQVDSTVGALAYMTQDGGGFLEFLRQETERVLGAEEFARLEAEREKRDIAPAAAGEVARA